MIKTNKNVPVHLVQQYRPVNSFWELSKHQTSSYSLHYVISEVVNIKKSLKISKSSNFLINVFKTNQIILI